MNRILVLDIKNFPDKSISEMNEIFRRYIEETWNAKLNFYGNYPNIEALKSCSLIITESK